MFTLQPVKVRTGSLDDTGRLVFEDGLLVALLVRLDDPVHEDQMGCWNLEAALDGLPTVARPFSTLNDALGWIDVKLNAAEQPSRTNG